MEALTQDTHSPETLTLTKSGAAEIIRGTLAQNRSLLGSLFQICNHLREGERGAALEVAESALGKPDQFTAACNTIKHTLETDPAVTTRLFHLLTMVIYEVDKARTSDPGSHAAPFSVNDRELLAAKILNSLFGTKL